MQSGASSGRAQAAELSFFAIGDGAAEDASERG
jgi:hypothetical protein